MRKSPPECVKQGEAVENVSCELPDATIATCCYIIKFIRSTVYTCGGSNTEYKVPQTHVGQELICSEHELAISQL